MPDGVPYQVVVSADNSLYLAWQTQVFCLSAWKALRQRAIVVVHGSEPLRPEFGILRDAGYPVIRADSYDTTADGRHFPPRNELGSLLQASALPITTDHILFCEPDMLFVRAIPYPDALAAEFYSYLRYDQPRIVRAARKCGAGHLITQLNDTCRIGVPYLIPRRYLTRLATRWIAVLDTFDELHWIDIMYAFGIALITEGLDVEVTHSMTDNSNPMRPPRSLIHYCLGDSVWNKRHFVNYSPLELPLEALSGGLQGTVVAEILRQMRAAKTFYA